MKLKLGIILLIIILMLSVKVYAMSIIIDQADDFIQTGNLNKDNTMDPGTVQAKSTELYKIFLLLGTGVAIIVGAILGIKFMSAGIDKKVETKEALVAYVVSCIVLFSAFGIWKLVVTLLKQI